MIMAGMAGMAISTALFLFVGLDTSQWWIRGIMFLRGIFFGLALIPLQAATFSTISPRDSGRASSLFSTNRQVASSFGVAILATVLTDRTKTHVEAVLAKAPTMQPDQLQNAIQNARLDGYHDAYFAGVVFAVIGFAASFLIHDEDAAASMAPADETAKGKAEAGEQAAMAH
jgi:MFS family permease